MLALADCNNFYASCERLFKPKLERTPIVVLSNNDGCVIARSNEAKSLGIAMGAPAFEIKELIEKNNVHVFSSNYTLYGDISARVMNTLGTFTPSIEIYSIDEAFLDLSNMSGVDLTDYTAAIRETVKQNVGIPISIGVAKSKTLAKAANKYAKKNAPNGVFVIDSEAIRKAVLRWLPVEDVWGIGRQYSLWLQQNNITTALQLADCNLAWIRKKMGVVGERLVRELNGEPCIQLEEQASAKKGICTSRSFGELVTDKQSLSEAVATFTTRCAEKLRSQKSCCGVIQVFAHTNSYRTQDRQYHGSLSIPLHTATNDTSELIHYAMIAMQRIYRPGYNYKKAGVFVTDIVPQEQVQLSMFDNVDRGKQSKLMAAMDGINKQLGRDKVRYAAAGYGRKWKLRQEQLSPCYTTNIHEILKVRI
jgi:DNA polymerase V